MVGEGIAGNANEIWIGALALLTLSAAAGFYLTVLNDSDFQTTPAQKYIEAAFNRKRTPLLDQDPLVMFFSISPG